MIVSLVEGTLLICLTSLLLRIAPGMRPARRFLTWFVVLLALAIGLFSIRAIPRPEAVEHVGLAIAVPDSLARVVFVLWCLVTLIQLLRVGVGLVELWKLRRSATGLETQALPAPVQQVLAKSRRRVRLSSGPVQVPVALGFFHPLIVVPNWLLGDLSSDELVQVVLHEVAHVNRWDDWTNLIQQLLSAALFFHPAVWWIGRTLSLEREMACDEIVVRATNDPNGYARFLAALAERSYLRRAVLLAHAAVRGLRQTSERVRHILGLEPGFARWQSRPVLGVLILLTGLAAMASGRVPTLIRFRPSVIPLKQRASDNVLRTSFKPQASIAPRNVGPQATAVALKERHPRVRARAAGPTMLRRNLGVQALFVESFRFPGEVGWAPRYTGVVWVVSSGGTSVRASLPGQIQAWRIQIWVPDDDALGHAATLTARKLI